MNEQQMTFADRQFTEFDEESFLQTLQLVLDRVDDYADRQGRPEDEVYKIRSIVLSLNIGQERTVYMNFHSTSSEFGFTLKLHPARLAEWLKGECNYANLFVIRRAFITAQIDGIKHVDITAPFTDGRYQFQCEQRAETYFERKRKHQAVVAISA